MDSGEILICANFVAENRTTLRYQEGNKTGTSEVGAVSTAQKAQNIFGKELKFLNYFFFRKMSHSAEKMSKGDPF